MYELTRQYRTVHSINDRDVSRLLDLTPPTARTIVDFGCHLGHLSFEFALHRCATIYSVDTFTGTLGDERMAETIAQLTGDSGDFFELFVHNMEECREAAGGFLGEIIPVRAGDFFERVLPGLVIDLAFIDSSHREDDVWEFEAIARRVRPGGVLAGHDNDPVSSMGVVEGIASIIDAFEWIEDSYTWFLRKKPAAIAAA